MLQLGLFATLLLMTLIPMGLVGLMTVAIVVARGERRAKLRLLVLPGV